jgi:hypothetical protein
MQSVAVTCDKGDEISHRIKPRQRPPFEGDLYFSCDFCDHNGDIRKGGFYACKNADINCDFDCCPNCYNTKISKISKS